MTNNFRPETELSENVRTRFYIGGAWVLPHSDRTISLVDPATEKAFFFAPVANGRDVEDAIDAARTAFDQGSWPRMSGAERGQCLRKFAAALRARLPLFSRLWTAQVGAPIGFADIFSAFLPAGIEYYAGLAEVHRFEERRETPRGHARVMRQPIGVTALIIPWNAPMPILANKLGGALAAGCTVIVKSSPETPLDAMLLAECAAEAGLPPGVVNVITAERDESAHLVSSAKVDKVSFTGSTAAGKQIASACSARLTRFTLELGGKSAAIVLDDAPLDATLAALAPFTMPFSGQICFAQTRILVPRSRQDEFVQAYCEIISALKIGDPWDDTTQIGPLATRRQFERVLDYIEKGKKDGARLVVGGQRSEQMECGYYIVPTVFADVTSEMTIAQEEIFGPVVVIIAYDNVDDAVRIANDSPFGLSGSVYGSDIERALQIAKRIRAGNVSINGLEISSNVPFGGFKQSGVGREGGPEGLNAFLEDQAIYMPHN